MKTVQILLEKLTVVENGELDATISASTLSAVLTYPNPGTPAVTTVKALKLADRKEIDFTGVDPNTGLPYTYSDRILFKEELVGRSEIAIRLATISKTPKIEKFVNAVIGAVFGAAWKLAVGGITNVFLAAAVETTGTFQGKSFETEDDRTRPLGAATIPLDEGTVVSGSIDVPFAIPADFTIERFESHPPNPPVRVKHTFAKGTANGTLRLTVTVL